MSLNFIRTNWRFFLKQSIGMMGILSSIVTITSVAYPNINGCDCIWKCCLGISFIWGVYMVCPNNNISVTFIRRRTVKIKFGDLFKEGKDGIIVIPVNNYLDTQIENDVIGENTVHGKFISYYNNAYPDKNLDSEINKALDRDGIASVGTTSSRKAVVNGKNSKYPLGTIVRIIEGKQQFYLAVITEFDEHNHVIYQPEKFATTILIMMKNIDRYNSGNPVYMPIIGSGQTGLNMSKQETLSHILQCFNLADHYITTGGTTIVIYEKDKQEISLNKIKYEFSNME